MVIGPQRHYYKFSLSYALRQVPGNDWLEIIVNHKFAVYKGFKKSLPGSNYIDLIRDFNDLEIEYYDKEQLSTSLWKIYVNDELFEKLILDRENEWYNKHSGIIKKTEVEKNVDEI